MLNISDNSTAHKINVDKYNSFEILKSRTSSVTIIRVFVSLLLLLIMALFLPWTQNIRSIGYVTTLRPEARPQAIQAVIGGQIDKWYVREGQTVSIGDTIVRIREVKQDYLDPQILERTQGQIDAKDGSVSAYRTKEQRLNDQLIALKNNRDIKLEQNQIKAAQTRLKITSDSIDLVAAQVKLGIANNQLVRSESLYNDGIKPLTDLEAKRLSVQNANAKTISLKNKIETGKNELVNIQANIIAIESDYQEKAAKIRSDIASTRSNRFTTEASINKLQSTYNAYNERQENFYIKSPINGIITKTLTEGIGAIIKDQERVATIMPENYQLAIEMYVEPQDMPLLTLGRKVRIQFDGWPAIVFSGWPNNSYGTFGGKVWAIDQFISDNGKYRILVAPDEEESEWPDEIRVGGGANTITLLENVSVGYEIWRQLNGFPPDYYEKSKNKDLKSKAPLRKVK